jgi:4-hydroxybenzoate polyprenyltransferase
MTRPPPPDDASPDGLARPAVADAPAGNWVDRFAPEAARPYLRLARMDRPVGTWLLLFPCWWSLALAEVSAGRPYPGLPSLLLFAAGALIMRGAGCAYNDFVDHEYDARVARTASRPIPSGQVTPDAALVFALCLAALGFLILMQFNLHSTGARSSAGHPSRDRSRWRRCCSTSAPFSGPSATIRSMPTRMPRTT